MTTRCRGLAIQAIALLLAAAPASLPAQSDADGSREVTVSVQVQGIEGELRENVLAFLTVAGLEELGFWARLDPRRSAPTMTLDELERRHRAAPSEIRQALMPYGYYLPAIASDLVETRNGYEARYRVEPGPPARLRNVDIRVEGEGAEFDAVRQAVAAAGLNPGDQLNHLRYQNAREAIFDAVYDRGFLRAQWRNRDILVAPDRLSADIRLVLDTGPRFYFGEVEIQAERLNPDFLERFTDIEPGEPYDVRRLLALQLSLNDTEYFSMVEIRAEPGDADAANRIPVMIRTEPVPSQRYDLGVGYATDTGPRLNAGLQLRRVNARGHRLRSELQVSPIERALAARYAVPIRNVAVDQIDYSLTARRLQVGDADSRQYTGGVSEYTSWRGFRRRAYLQLQREEFRVGADPQQTARMFYPGLTLTREISDDVLYPRRGYSLQFDLRGSSDQLLSDVSFLRLRADARRIAAYGERTRLLLRGEAGALATETFTDLPPTQRFYAGGDRSVRGYAYQMIGERNEAGEVIGGRYLLVASVEAERLVFGDFGVAAFADAGDAFRHTPDPQVGAGVGVRWRSPVGMVRLDVAHPFHSPANFRVHFSIGADL